jgi:hypothetical protein
MEKIGSLSDAGFTHHHLLRAQQRFEALGCPCELVDLVHEAGLSPLYPTICPAFLLVVHGAVDAILEEVGKGAADAFLEHARLDTDKKALMYGRVVNKSARHNLCFAEVGSEPAYEEGRGRVVAWADVPLTSRVRAALPEFLGAIASGLVGEGNYYYDVTKCGIGFHGDAERRKVVGVRLGAAIPLHYQWFHKGQPVGDRVERTMGHGCLYVMSEKAVGFDWRCSSKLTLRHAAGADRFLALSARKALVMPTAAVDVSAAVSASEAAVVPAVTVCVASKDAMEMERDVAVLRHGGSDSGGECLLDVTSASAS